MAVAELTSRDLEGRSGMEVVWICPTRFSLPRMLDLKPVERKRRELQSLKKTCKKTVFKALDSLKSSNGKVCDGG